MRKLSKRGIVPRPTTPGETKTNVAVIGVSKVDGTTVVGRANTQRKRPRRNLRNARMRIGDRIKSDPWKRVNPT